VGPSGPSRESGAGVRRSWEDVFLFLCLPPLPYSLEDRRERDSRKQDREGEGQGKEGLNGQRCTGFAFLSCPLPAHGAPFPPSCANNAVADPDNMDEALLEQRDRNGADGKITSSGAIEHAGRFTARIVAQLTTSSQSSPVLPFGGTPESCTMEGKSCPTWRGNDRTKAGHRMSRVK
jgi:hypothetical protein